MAYCINLIYLDSKASEKQNNLRSDATELLMASVQGMGFMSFKFIHGQGQLRKCLRTCAKCTDLDPPVHSQSIIWAFTLHS